MIATVIQVLLAAFILTRGVIKLLRASFQVEHWQYYEMMFMIKIEKSYKNTMLYFL